jgi:hypothetical protein
MERDEKNQLNIHFQRRPAICFKIGALSTIFYSFFELWRTTPDEDNDDDDDDDDDQQG